MSYAILSNLHVAMFHKNELSLSKMRMQVEKINSVLAQLDKPEGLVPMYLNPHTGKWGSRELLIIIA